MITTIMHCLLIILLSLATLFVLLAFLIGGVELSPAKGALRWKCVGAAFVLIGLWHLLLRFGG